MKGITQYIAMGLALPFFGYANSAYAAQTNGNDNGKGKQTLAKAPDDPSKYKYYEASTLSGIDLKPNSKTGTFVLKFDQQLTESGTLVIKNTAGKVLYTNLIGAGQDTLSRTMDVGKLTPGIYSIEVKTSDTTFWKKVKISR